MKTHLGTIEMIKWIVVAFFILGSVYAIAHSPSKDYWENVGPQWDRMLNPCKFKEC
jgi:hypothetical protein